MLYKLLKKDFQRNKTITITLFLFIMIAALLASGGTAIITQLSTSLNHLFVASSAPHFIQMHAGDIDQSAIDAFAETNNLVKHQETAEMIVIDNANIYYDESADADSVMDNGFVKQNQKFDFLLNLESEKITVSKGEIAVPIYYMQQQNLKIGDTITISDDAFNMTFTISDFVRDVEMNSSIISSKRFVVNEQDFDQLKRNTGEIEYLIQFQLKDVDKVDEFTTAYQSANLPQKGPTIGYSLLKMANALTDGIIAAIIFLVSILLIVIAILCLRFTILTTMEEDYKEIGVMKAMGIRQWDIKKIYVTKYMVMTASACFVGYVISLFTSQLFTANIALYIGTAPKSMIQHLIPLLAVGLLFVIILLCCLFILRRFTKITAVEALRSGTMGESKNNPKRMPLYKSKIPSTNFFLGFKDVWGRFNMYFLLFFIFVICSFIIIVPINLLHTSQSPSFMSYMGVGKSDIRMDLQHSDDIINRFEETKKYLSADKDIEKFATFVTSKYSVIGSDGKLENMNVETGDFSIFPVKYINGTAPSTKNEIALSSLHADGLEKEIGDTVTLVIDGQNYPMKVSGIYQDITNGGKTAKALLPYHPDNVLWYNISIDMKQDVAINEKIDQYTELFPGTKITSVEEYMSQTLGSTIEQIKLVTLLATIISLFIAILITSLFLKMLIAKDTTDIAIMKSLGFSTDDIRKQYVTRTLTVLASAIVIGTIAANTLGESLVGMMMSSMGASEIEFVINPIVTYLLCPLALGLIVTITTLASTLSMKNYSISKMMME